MEGIVFKRAPSALDRNTREASIARLIAKTVNDDMELAQAA